MRISAFNQPLSSVTMQNPVLISFRQRPKVYAWAAFFYVLTMLWVSVMTQGLPIGDFDDWDHLMVAQDLSWKTVLQPLATPWSTSIHWHGQVNRINEMTHRRVFLTVALKSVNGIFGLRFFPYYLFTKAIFFAATVGLVFLLLVSMTGSWPISLFGLLFYFLVPAHYPHLFWITDPITLVQCFMLLSVWAYFKIAEDWEKLFRNSWKWFAVLFFFGWLGMKTKEPALTVFLALLIFTLANLRHWTQHKKKFFLLAVLLGHLCLLLIPLQHLAVANRETPIRLVLATIFRMYFRNFQCGYEDEAVSAFFSWKRLFPVSIARTFGFSLLWALVFSWMAYAVMRIRRNPQLKIFLRHPIAQLAVIWLLIDTVFMSMFQPDPRYFSSAMIPLTLLAVRLIDCVLAGLGESRFRKGAWVVLMLAVGITYSNNIQSIFWLRGVIGARCHRFLYAAKTIYEDRYGPVKNMRDIGLFYSSTYVPDKSHPRFQNETFYTQLGYESWSKGERTRANFEKFASQGASYMIVRAPDAFPEDHHIKTLRVLDGINRESGFENLYYHFRKKTPDLFVIQKFNLEK